MLYEVITSLLARGKQPGGPARLAFEMLEPYDGKLSRTVLRGERNWKVPDLPDLIIIEETEIREQKNGNT